MRLAVSGTRSGSPLWIGQTDVLYFAGLEVENRGERRRVQPPTRFTGIDEQRVAAAGNVQLMRRPVHHVSVRLHRPPGHLAELVHQQDALTADFDAVRRLEQLDAHALRGE